MGVYWIYNGDMAKRKRRRKKNVENAKSMGLVVVLGVVLALVFNAFSGFSYDPIMEVDMREAAKIESVYDMTLITFTDGVASYESDTHTSLFGIDVSQHNKEIDWNAMKEAGVSFAMIRVGYRGYTEGTITMDGYFKKNIEGALSAGIEVGVYFFSQALNEEEAAEEAKWVIETIHEYDITWPVVYDMELYPEEYNARANNLSAEQRTKNAVVFLENVKNAGYTPMMYASTNTYDALFDTSYLVEYDFWVAQYDGLCEYPYEYVMWQYSDEGNANGIPAGIDLNIAFIEK